MTKSSDRGNRPPNSFKWGSNRSRANGTGFDPLRSLRMLDRQHYLACLYLPGDIRLDVAALWAFDAEIQRIPGLVSEPMPGEIRIQWWRDVLRSGDASGSGPLATTLMEIISRHNLPVENLDTCLEARIFDLYQDPMPDQGSFEGYQGETSSIFFQMAALCAGAARDPRSARS